MRLRLRSAFNPEGRCSPRKMPPTAGACMSRPRRGGGRRYDGRFLAATMNPIMAKRPNGFRRRPSCPLPLWKNRAPHHFRSVVSFPLWHGRLVLGLQGDPAWVEPTLRTLGSLFLLPAGSDSYGGRSPDPSGILAAWRLLSAVMRDDSPAPSVVPTAHGGVGWNGTATASIWKSRWSGRGEFVVSFEAEATGEVWEKTVMDDFAELSAALDRISGGPVHDTRPMTPRSATNQSCGGGFLLAHHLRRKPGTLAAVVLGVRRRSRRPIHVHRPGRGGWRPRRRRKS